MNVVSFSLHLFSYLSFVIAECLSAKFHVFIYKGIAHKGVYSQIDITNIIFKKNIYIIKQAMALSIITNCTCSNLGKL